MTLQELKAAAYDEMAIIEQAQVDAKKIIEPAQMRLRKINAKISDEMNKPSENHVESTN